jgi:hypothetical protein
MLKLEFIPESKDFIDAAKSYSNIWNEYGQKIVQAIEETTKLKFKDKEIKAVVFEGISQSHPMRLRASYDEETKKATLVHELLHRISADYMLPIPEANDEISIGLHKQIDLLLYDLWIELFGKDVADSQVKIESSRIATYKDAWDWALGLTKKQRQEKFAKLSAQ